MVHVENLGGDLVRAHACGLQSDPLQVRDEYRLRSADSLGRVYERVDR